ncbi:MAG: hypothetical protein GY804_10725 [Alphaproteobacteria bacterium]|nr:hypothetical protein [Alphaproteobacteria bacterium]
MKKNILAIAITLTFLTGCSAAHHRNAISSNDDKISVGTVQRKISKGMSGADVIAALGSPNIVSTDEKGREVWVYDKISTEHVRSESGLSLGLGAFGGTVGGLTGGSGSAGASSSSQKTLTIIVKFDNDNKVRDFAYHSSRF